MLLRREDSSPFLSPRVLKLLSETGAQTLQEADPKIKALLQYLRLYDPLHVEACLSRVVRHACQPPRECAKA